MKTKICFLTLLVLAGGLLRAQAQDQIRVYLPYGVRVGDRILEPSEYTIRQVSGTVLQIVRNPRDTETMKVEATVMTIPTESSKASEETKIVLQRFGDSYYLDKIWVQGKGSGYEFVLPERVKARERERALVSIYYVPDWPDWEEQ